MDKKKKYQFNQQSATYRLREEIDEISEGRVMFTIDDQKIDDLFSNKFQGHVDYVHKNSEVYYILDQNDLQKFVDYVESMGLDSNSIRTKSAFQEDMGGNITGNDGAYNASLNASSKKQNPFKEDVLSGYKQDKKFRPGHTKDRGGFQYKDLWGLNENKLLILKEMNQIVDEVFSHEDYKKVLQVIEKIKYTNTKLYNAILDMISDVYPHDYGEVEAQMQMNEAVDMYELEMELKRIKKENPDKKVTYFFTKDEPKGYKIRIQDPKDKNLKESYSKFRNETKTRTKPEQFHQAVKSVKRKVEEIHKLYEYMERLKKELSEGSDGLKYKKYTENAIQKIKEAVKALQDKTKKLK